MTHRRTHAVVIGASMGGLLAARALHDTFDRVTVIERDTLHDTPGHRRGVAQGRHAHGLLAHGREVLEELFPGLTDDLVQQGAMLGDLQDETRWYNEGVRLRMAPSGLQGLLVSRPLLEHAVRSRVAALPGVRLVDACDVVGLVATSDGGRVTGVRLRPATGTEVEHVAAELVVDASGRASRSPAWLAELGYEPPATEEVEIGIAYATRTYRRAPHHLDGDRAVVVGMTRSVPRAGVVLAMEDDRWIVTLGGIRGDDAPLDDDGFAAFAASLPTSDVHDIVVGAEPLDEPRRYRYPASTRRRYERLAAFPEGYLVFGDAICSFNPVYGQGMTVAAAEALALRDCLARGTDRLARRFLRRAARIVDVPWDIAVGGDLRFPDVPGERTPKVRLVNAYLARLHRAAGRDPVVGRMFLRVANLMSRPERLLAPDIAVRVLLSGRRGTRGRHDQTGRLSDLGPWPTLSAREGRGERGGSVDVPVVRPGEQRRAAQVPELRA